MNKLLSVIGKNKKLCAGIMTGTSVDAVDVAIVEVSGSGVDLSLKLLGFKDFPIQPELKNLILKNSYGATSNVEEICKLNFILPQLYAEALKKTCSLIGITVNELDIIGSHGQTIQHLPQKAFFGKYSTTSTLQIGDPSVLAKLTGVVTVGNFRTADVALGGQGAPLVPYFDYLMFRSNSKNRLLLNLGGIANFTYLPANAQINEVIAFDVGPGNMLIDQAIRKFFNKKYDKDGAIAKQGKLNAKLLKTLKTKDDFIIAQPPKTAGRENYGEEFFVSLLDSVGKMPPKDWVHTLSYYTAFAAYSNYQKFILPLGKADELIVSGGGANNEFLLLKLSELFNGVKVKRLNDKNIQADSKEAVCFAVLANETIAGNPANIPAVTGAQRPTILGEICLP